MTYHKIEFIVFQETKQEKIDPSLLKAIASRFEFNWFSLPAKKTVRGILVDFRDDLFEIISFSARNFSVSAQVRNKNDNFIRKYMVVYGSAYPDQKVEFITKLHDVMETTTVPTLIGGF
jgi:hypothetical protein